jgi:hypothetical protein
MSESVETGRSPISWSPDARPLVDSTRSYDLRFGSLFLLVFVVNIAVVLFAWVLVSVLN